MSSTIIQLQLRMYNNTIVSFNVLFLNTQYHNIYDKFKVMKQTYLRQYLSFFKN